MKTWDYLERIRARNGADCSDYRLAQILGISRQAMSKYKVEAREADDEVAARIAAALDMPAARVLADIRHSAAKADGNAILVSLWAGVLQAFATPVVPLAAPALAGAAMSSAQQKPRARRGGKNWSGRQDSNLRPLAPEASALPS